FDFEIEESLYWGAGVGICEPCLEKIVLDQGTSGSGLGGVRHSMSWRQFILAMGLHTEEEMAKGPKKVTGVDLFYLRTMDHGTANVLYLLARYLFHFSEGRKGVPDYLVVTLLDV
ncbi:hypothetical protein Tco_0181769, partial [Tanacetum coccineum]